MATGCNLFVLGYNRRNDNLGDQVIFQALTRALAPFGTLLMPPPIPDFVERVDAEGGRWLSRIQRSHAVLRGRSVWHVLPPGASLWDGPPGAIPHARGPLRSGVAAWLEGRRLALGLSVIPEADHSWCRHVDWIGVRDAISRDALRAAGVSQVDYFPDLAFLADCRQSITERRTVGFSFRGSIPEERHDPSYGETVAAAFLRLVRETGLHRDSLLGFHQVSQDVPFLESIANWPPSARWHRDMLTLADYEEFYGAQDIVISNRLHCLLLAAACGAIPIALTTEKHFKVTSLFRTVGWDSLVIDARSPSEMGSRFDQIRRDAAHIRAMVRDTVVRQNALGTSILRELFRGVRATRPDPAAAGQRVPDEPGRAGV